MRRVHHVLECQIRGRIRRAVLLLADHRAIQVVRARAQHQRALSDHQRDLLACLKYDVLRIEAQGFLDDATEVFLDVEQHVRGALRHNDRNLLFGSRRE